MPRFQPMSANSLLDTQATIFTGATFIWIFRYRQKLSLVWPACCPRRQNVVRTGCGGRVSPLLKLSSSLHRSELDLISSLAIWVRNGISTRLSNQRMQNSADSVESPQLSDVRNRTSPSLATDWSSAIIVLGCSNGIRHPMEIVKSRRIECQLSPLRSEARFDEASGEG
jgi:hypothetical protein